MENDSIVITAKLNTTASEGLILHDLNTIERDLKSVPLKINCIIDPDALAKIQSQLSKTLTINANVNAQNIRQNINQVVKSEPIKVNVEADIKKGELQKQINAFVEKFHLTFDKGESQALKAELGEILAKYDQVKKAGNWNEMNKQWDNLTSFVEQYATEIDVVSEKLKEATKQSKLFITESQKEQLIATFGSKGAAADYLNSIIGRFKWTYNKNNGGLGWDIYSTKLNDLIQTGLYDVNANSIDDVAKINTTHIVEGLAKLGELLNQDKSLVNDWYNTYANDLEALQQMWDGLRTSVVDYLHQIRGENQSVADMGFVDIGSSESTEKVRNYTEVLNEGLAKIASLKAQIYSEGGDTIKSVTSRFTADATGNLDGFVLAVQKSNGEVENLYHKLVEVEDETGKVTREWSRTQITGSDKGVAKLQQDIARLQKELASFESSHKSIESGLTQPLEVARNALADLKNNVGSVETVQKALDNLKTVAANIGSNLKATGSSFNVFDNAANKAQNFDNTIKTLGIDIGKLAITDSKTGLVEQLELAKQRLADFKQIESEQGRGLEWSSRYAEISSLIQSITNNLKVAQKEDAVLNKELEHQQELREKIATEQQQQQHGYWQGRFEETIKAMTAENTVLKEMRQYYADMAKEAQQKENAFNREFERELKAEEKLEAEQQKRLATARELREEQQHNYWQGRFEDSVKGLTAENSILKEMRQYYEQLNKEAEKLNRTQSQDNNKALQEANKLIKDNLSALEKFNNSAIANNNKNNPLVASQTGLNSGYIAQLQGLQESLANDKSAENVARVKARLEELSNLLRDARFNSEALQQSLADGNAEAKFSAKLNQLKNQVEIFANTNRRATESLKQMRNGMTFAEEWQRIVSQLKSGNLDENAIRRLSEDLRNFKGEAQSAGLTVNKFFQSMGSQLRMVMQRWVSLYAIIGRITSAFNELKSVDKILTEIAKSSDVTRESLESLGNAAFDMANKYGRSVTDYLYGVQEFSRAGFRGDQLTGLTQVSLLAQSAGDIETDLANSYVIATNAAYGLAGSQEKLGEVLDRQNYVTNNYALNMTDLANATKIAASQAAQSGVEIDQMTAALATMISTTQQGGEIAARSLRGILMNIQQVKGEVGDGEEDITAESLTKYEKAAKDLGVALKEVKDGVAVLRDPMAVLNDLAEAFNKEADDSIKKANLINAIGGKYRGNQLAALLSNWETYKNILEDFNSDKALGSAVRESQKDVASWTGQLTILKNNWDAFIKSVVDSDTAIGTLKALNGVMELLKTTSKGLGGLGTVSTLIAGIAGVKGSGILSSIQRNAAINKQISGITLDDVSALRQYNALLTQGVSAAEANATALGTASASARQLATNANGAAVSEELLVQAQNKLTTGAKAAAIASKALGTALNIAINMGVVAIFSAVIKLIDKLVVTEKEAAKQAAEMREKSYEAVVEFQNESKQLNDVTVQYAEIITSTSDLSTKKEELLNLQKQLPDSYKDEADGIDFVNGKISENIKLLDEMKQKEAEQYVSNNQGAYETALQELSKRSRLAFNASGLKSFIGNDDVRKFLLTLDNVVKNSESWTGLQNDAFADFTISGTYEDQLNTLVQIRDFYKELDGHNVEWLSQLDNEISRIQNILDTNKAITSEMEKQRGLISITAQEYNMIDQAALAYREYQTALADDDTKGAANALNALQSIKDVVYSMSEPSSALRTEFDNVWNTFSLGAENALSNLTQVQADFDKMLNETYGEELKNIDNIEKTIESMMNEETLSHDDAWNIINLDTEGILKDIKLVNGEYKLSTDELLKLMQVRINKKKEEIQLMKESAEAELANAKARLESIKINSLDDVKAYAGVIEEIEGDIKDSQDIIAKTSYLLDELDTKGRKIERIAGDTGKQLNATVKALEVEVETIDATIDTLNDRKDALESEKDLLQDQLDILNEQKEAIEDTIKKYDAVADAVSGYAKAQTDAIQEQIDAMEEAAESIKKDYDDQISELEEQNEERDDALKKEKALADLQNAQNQKKRVFSAERGWEYQSSKEDILTAQKELADIETEQRIKSLEKERDAKLAEIDNHKEVYELQIKAYEDYAKKYSDISSNIKQTENELLAEQILGADWREKITEEAQSSIETLFGNWGTFGGLDIAFTPVLKTSNSTEVLDSQTISDYINAIIQKAGGDLSAANILALDSTGLDVNGKTIKNIIADVGATAEQTSKIIRYIGKDGVYNLVSKQIGNVTSTLDIGIDKVHETNEALLGNTEMLNKFEGEYKEYNNQLNNLVNNEIKNLQDSIDMKQAEIDKIDDEIKAYNKYKSSVQSNLNNAKDALESYKNTMNTVKTDTINYLNEMSGTVGGACGAIGAAIAGMENSIWSNHNKILDWFREVGNAAREMYDEVGQGATGAGFLGLKLAGFSKGGVNDYTGLAMLHGTKQNPETIFNANDSKKLYDLVHNTPNLIESIVKQAGQISSFTPTTINNRNDTNSSNISVNIGQVVANNPQELTRNLDTHLDSYFRRKLTMGYVQ